VNSLAVCLRQGHIAAGKGHGVCPAKSLINDVPVCVDRSIPVINIGIEVRLNDRLVGSKCIVNHFDPQRFLLAISKALAMLSSLTFNSGSVALLMVVRAKQLLLMVNY